MSQKKAALRRWDILADVIKSKNCPPEADGSKRCFQSYNILHMEPCEQENGWKRVSYKDVSVRIRYLPAKLDLSQLVGFNNTGNVCVWPSEESLAIYCLNNIIQLKDKHVLEIGGGMTSLAGCMVSVTGAPASTHLSDGNITSVENLNIIVDDIKKTSVVENLEAFQLRWDEENDHLECQYDVIICADCLFFKESSEKLVKLIHKLLRPKGKAFIVAPHREGTFDHFKSLAEPLFSVEEVMDYSKEVTKAHESCLSEPGYTPDIHYPKLMVLNK